MREGACIGGATLDFGEYISQNRSHPQGPKSEFKEVTAAHVGCHCSGFPGSFLSGALSSYGASAVARTSGSLSAEDMWQKYKPFFIEVFGILNQGFPVSSLLREV